MHVRLGRRADGDIPREGPRGSPDHYAEQVSYVSLYGGVLCLLSSSAVEAVLAIILLAKCEYVASIELLET